MAVTGAYLPFRTAAAPGADGGFFSAGPDRLRPDGLDLPETRRHNSGISTHPLYYAGRIAHNA